MWLGIKHKHNPCYVHKTQTFTRYSYAVPEIEYGNMFVFPYYRPDWFLKYKIQPQIYNCVRELGRERARREVWRMTVRFMVSTNSLHKWCTPLWTLFLWALCVALQFITKAAVEKVTLLTRLCRNGVDSTQEQKVKYGLNNLLCSLGIWVWKKCRNPKDSNRINYLYYKHIP